MTYEQRQMWQELNRIMAVQAAREIVQVAEEEINRITTIHDQWKREDNAWRIPLLHRAELSLRL